MKSKKSDCETACRLPAAFVGHMMPSLPATRQMPRPDFTDVSEVRRRNLAAVRSKDTKPELAVRRLLHAMGYRYRLQRRDLPGRPDIVFPARRAVVDIRGCFWHRCPDPTCKNSVLPRTRSDWWAAKLNRNVQRDDANQAALEAAGWRVLVVWECKVRRELQVVRQRLTEFLGPAGSTSKRRSPDVETCVD